MNYIKCDIYTKSEAIYTLTAILEDLGINGFDIHDSSDFEDFLADTKGNWDYVDDSLNELKNVPTYITFYLSADEEGVLKLKTVKECILNLSSNRELFGTLDIKLSEVKEEDWENNWKKYFKPFSVGKKIIIKPTWENTVNPDNRLVLEIDPASTFGTGQHATTKLCIEGLEDYLKKDNVLLDLGTGSGILSIAALLLGASMASIVDITQNAVETAKKNILKNNFSKERFKAFHGNILADNNLIDKIGSGYDLVTANIVADVIIAMSGLFHKFLKPSGILIVSGIIDNRLKDVRESLAVNNFTVLEERCESEWNMVVLKRIK